jgi:hypothetical protein
VSWAGTLVLTIIAWRSGASSRSRDPPFTHPEVPDVDDDDDVHGDEESQYHVVENPTRRATNDNAVGSPFKDEAPDNRYSSATYSTGYSTSPTVAPAMPRPSIDAYGAFSDPAPTGYAAPTTTQSAYGGPTSPSSPSRMSRTMQYADPYAAVRASIAGSTSGNNPGPAPSYESYQGYR